MSLNSLSFVATQALVFPKAVYTTVKNAGVAYNTFATETKEAAVNKIALLRLIGFSAAMWATASVVAPIPLIGWAATFLPTASPFSGVFPMAWTVFTFVTGHDLLRLAQNKEGNVVLGQDTFTGPVLGVMSNKVNLITDAATNAYNRLNRALPILNKLIGQ